MFGLDYDMTKFQLGSTMLTVQPNLLFGLFRNLTTTEVKVTAFLSCLGISNDYNGSINPIGGMKAVMKMSRACRCEWMDIFPRQISAPKSARSHALNSSRHLLFPL